MAYDLHSEFDIQKHKETFVNYLEVVIEPDGQILYAVPSHQEKLIELICHYSGWTREELNSKCPPEYYFDFLDWLLDISKCISVWNDFYQGKPNVFQLESLQKLKDAGLYRGKIDYEAVLLR